jgi:thioredoxin 1
MIDRTLLTIEVLTDRHVFNKFLKSVGLKSMPPTLPREARPASTNQPAPIDVTDVDFAEVVLQSEQLTVVDFWAEWCEPCHVMSAYMGFLLLDFADRVRVAALDVEENPEIQERYTIMGLPTLVFFRNGEEVDRIVGVVNYQELKQRVEKWLDAC